MAQYCIARSVFRFGNAVLISKLDHTYTAHYAASNYVCIKRSCGERNKYIEKHMPISLNDDFYFYGTANNTQNISFKSVNSNFNV